MRKWVIGLVVVLTLTSVASANLLVNPSFETAGANVWTPDGWDRTDPGVYRSDTGTWGAEWIQDGTWTMRSEMGGLGNDLAFGQDVTVDVGMGTIATFSIFVLRNNNASFDDVYVDLGWKWDGGDAWQTASLHDAVLAQNWGSGWVQHTVAFTNTHAGVNGLSLWVNVDNYDSTLGSADLLFDSALLSIPEPTAVGLLGFGALLVYALRRKKA